MTEEEVKQIIRQMILDGEILIEKNVNSENENTEEAQEQFKLILADG